MTLHFITAGVGSKNFEEAAERLAANMRNFQIFDSVRVFKTEDVEKFAPEIFDWYQKDELMSLKGFGWYVWKSRFAKEVITNRFNDSDVIMYLDAGCEAFISEFSRRRLQKYIQIAKDSGACLFKIPTPEKFYTKKLVLERFNVQVSELDDYQFQSGSWIMRGEVAREFINSWDSIVWENPKYTDESISPLGEIPGFVCNRYDQAVFSMVARSFGLNYCGDIPPGDITRLKPRLRLFFYPFAWARNRTGKTLISPIMVNLGYLTTLPRRILVRLIKQT